MEYSFSERQLDIAADLQSLAIVILGVSSQLTSTGYNWDDLNDSLIVLTGQRKELTEVIRHIRTLRNRLDD